MKGFVTFFSFKTTTQKCFLSFGHYVYMIRTVGKYRVHSSKLGSSFKSKVWLSTHIIYERFKQILSTDLGFHCYIPESVFKFVSIVLFCNLTGWPISQLHPTMLYGRTSSERTSTNMGALQRILPIYKQTFEFDRFKRLDYSKNQ